MQSGFSFGNCVTGTRGVTILFPQAIHIAIFDTCMYYDTIRFIGNCNYSLKSMLVDMGAAMFFFI
jgi:hypothetical protein